MKRILFIVLCTLTLFSCKKQSDGSSRATTVVLNKERVDMSVGDKFTLSAHVLPQDLNMGVVWDVTEPEYATVENGVISALKEGVTYVIATSADGAAKTSCMVSVNPPIHYKVYLQDPDGDIVTSIYAYPSLEVQYSAVSSDGVSHDYTWSCADEEVAIVNDGKMLAGSPATEDAEYLYYGTSYITVRSEDDYGTSVPVTVSIMNGFSIDDNYYNMGTTQVVEVNTEYKIRSYYKGADGETPLPLTAYIVESSDPEMFKVEAGEGCYKLKVGSGKDLPGTLTFTYANGREVEAATLVAGHFGIQASWMSAYQYSSAVAFTWTEGIDADDDVSHPYTISLYEDADCQNLVRSFDIPAGSAAWGGKQPKYIFGRLESGRRYYFKVKDTTPGSEKESALIVAKTSPFTIVTLPTMVYEPGIILSENFGEIQWDYDHMSGAAGFKPSNTSDFSNSGVNTYRKSGDGSELTFQSYAAALANSRLAGWARDTGVYIHPGYMKLGTASGRGWILTPEIPVPEGKKAIVKVSVTACRYSSSQDESWAITSLTPAEAKVDGLNADFAWPDPMTGANYQEVDLTTSLTTQSIEGLEVYPNNRIAFGGRNSGDSKKGRVFITAMVIEVLDVVDAN